MLPEIAMNTELSVNGRTYPTIEAGEGVCPDSVDHNKCAAIEESLHETPVT